MREARPAARWLTLGYVALALCFLAGYAPTLGYQAVWDDKWIGDSQARYPRLIDGLRTTQDMQIDEVFVQTAGLRVPYDTYRPLLYASYRLDRVLSGLAPWAMHLHNLVIAALNVALLALLARRAQLPPAVAFALTAAFAVHPVQIESVAYISARGDLLAGSFALLALLAAQHSAQGHGRRQALAAALAAGVCLMLSLFAKETHAALPVAVAIVALALQRMRAAAPAIAAMVAAIAAYVLVRVAVLGPGSLRAGGDGVVPLLEQIVAVVGQSVQVIALPLDLSIQRPPVDDYSVLGALLLLLGGALVLARRRVSRAAALAGAGVLALFPVLAPAAVAAGSNGVLADRYLYAAVPLVVLAAAMLARAGAAHARARAPAYGAVALWVSICLAVWPAALSAWHDDVALYTRATEVAPEHSDSWARLGQLMARRGDWARASALLERAVARDPLNQRARNNLGVVRLNQRRYEQAIEQFDVTLRLTADRHYRARFNKGLALLALGRTAQACDQFRHCLRVNSAYERARQALREHCGGR